MRYFLLGLLVWGVFTTFCRHHYVCKIKGLCGEEEVVANARAKTLAFADDGNVVFDGFDQFAFNGSNIDLNDNNEAYLQKVADWMKANPGKKLKIVGKFLESEQGVEVGIFENLGQVRADAARKLLSKLGVDENRIAIDYKMVSGDTLESPLSFGAKAGDDGDAKPDDYNKDGEKLSEASFTFTNMTYSDANFEYNSDVFKPGSAFQTYADSVKTYLELNPNKSLTIIGHTDNKGSNTYNDGLGARRAKSAKRYFEGIGVEGKKISTATKGERQPIATNKTDAGRQKNRRVNVQIK